MVLESYSPTLEVGKLHIAAPGQSSCTEITRNRPPRHQSSFVCQPQKSHPTTVLSQRKPCISVWLEQAQSRRNPVGKSLDFELCGSKAEKNFTACHLNRKSIFFFDVCGMNQWIGHNRHWTPLSMIVSTSWPFTLAPSSNAKQVHFSFLWVVVVSSSNGE